MKSWLYAYHLIVMQILGELPEIEAVLVQLGLKKESHSDTVHVEAGAQPAKYGQDSLKALRV